MDVSVIIPTIHTNDLMLAAAVNAAECVAEQVIVEDAGGTFAEQSNRGATRASGDLLVMLNDDVVPHPGWLGHLLYPFKDPTVAITGARLVYPSGSLAHAGIYLSTEDGVLTARNICWEAASGPAVAVSGACLAIRRETFEKVGGFDEAFRNGYEDVDLCLRVRTFGYQIIYVAEATVFHHESQSPGRFAHAPANIQLLQDRWLNGDGTGNP